MDWRQFIQQVKVASENLSYHVNLPVETDLLSAIKASFNLLELPAMLEGLLQQSDGIDERFDTEKIGELIWSAQTIIERNKEFRSFPDFKDLYMSFDQLLFFSDGGNGDLFAFVTLNGRFNRNDIFAWNHEDDSRIWVAPDLKTFIEWWLAGSIKI